MAKPKNIPIDGKDYFGWYYEEQTKIKHRVLGAYSKIWISKLGKYNDTMFFDCHAGCGAYIDKETNNISYGSSFIVEEIANSINLKRSHKNYICACEIEPKYYENYKRINTEIGQKTIAIKNDNFENVMETDKVKRYYSTHPTLFFVDPFGYSMKMSSIEKMMKNEKNEVFINFMYDFISRFLNVTDKKILNEFFGTTEWEKANNLSKYEREKFLIDLYKEKIKKITKAKYVFAYKICFADKNQTYYYLVHVTNSIQGITYMKDSFASVNNGRVEYLGKRQNEITFFDIDIFKHYDFAKTALVPYANQTLTFSKVWESVADKVPYTRKDLSEALETLRTCGKLKIERVSSKRGQYRDDDLIIFGEEI